MITRKLNFNIILASILAVFASFGFSDAIKQHVKQDVEKILADSKINMHVGIKVVSLVNGKCLYHKNARQLFVPASNTKIFTGAAALHYLGPQFCYETQLLSNGPTEEGVVKGDIIIKGAGDPSLKVEDLEKLVSELKKSGINKIDGSIILDDTCFDTLQFGPGWTADNGAYLYNSPTNGLNINHNCIEIDVKSNESNNAVAFVLNPVTDFVKVVNEATNVAAEEPESLKIKRRWLTRENVIEICGGINLPNTVKKGQFTIENPTLYVGTLFKELLDKHGIQNSGKLSVGLTDEHAKILLSHKSEPLFKLIATMLKDSDNLYAECLFKTLGRLDSKSQGNWTAGKDLMVKFIGEVLKSTEDFAFADGSGMSRYNLISPHTIVTLLYWLSHQENIGKFFADGLPIAGLDGTLAKRMTSGNACGNAKAKTGGLNTIRALSGFVNSKDNEPLVFSFMFNGFVKPGKDLEDLADKLCQYFASAVVKA